ncbi:MAG: XRE family transcriptional regulator [Candidatus Tokpelaia sp.]|uniref:helix-turn-helix domain-containing protein n=1 Tax=Candidatus Tokpelaia sp. TaxID=2233777 RepID=UPI00123B4686|nr:helix-turn-helix transcriptional regulator [Candidatus Tokpelaia sp.]KAA6205861.1 MAG: XRE family transcriptional regulator [Candidatus Tokpelaia sp.]KAA6207711.1 MAG: XRE family transcriptional regulator [Candidatus Tokpelaia sp.]KAA6404884.1 transcriptional regulator [Candidatus Tokpelaia sp.]
MKKLSKYVAERVKDPEFKREYEKLGDEFNVFEALLKARAKAKMSQVQVAEKFKTSQANIARLESGRVSPNIATLQRYARAIGAELKIEFVHNRDAKAS